MHHSILFRINFILLCAACVLCSCATPTFQLQSISLKPDQSIEQTIDAHQVYNYSLGAKKNDRIILDIDQSETILYVKLISPRGDVVSRFAINTYERNHQWVGRETLQIDTDTSGVYHLIIQRFPGLEDQLKPHGSFHIQVTQWISAEERKSEIAEDDSLVAIVQKNAHPITSVEAGTTFSDLEPLKNILQNVRIVGLGEATHGTSEFFRMKHRMFEFLVKEMHFKMFGIELGSSDCQMINSYVLNFNGARDEAIGKLGYCRSDEVIAMVDWMREYNRTVSDSEKVQFYGFDIQGNNNSFKTIESFFLRTDTLQIRTLRNQWSLLFNADGYIKDTLSKVTAKIFFTSLQEYVIRNKTQFISATSKNEYFNLCQSISGIIQYIDLAFRKRYSETLDRPEESYDEARDRFMAENIQDFMEQRASTAKMVIWAHDAHILKQRTWTNSNSMGIHLQKMYGSDYYSFLFMFHHGSFHAHLEPDSAGYTFGVPKRGSLEWIFGTAGLGSSFMDFRTFAVEQNLIPLFSRARGFRIVGATYNPYWQEPYLNVTLKNYDGIVFIEKTSSSHSPADFWRPMDPVQEQNRKREEY